MGSVSLVEAQQIDQYLNPSVPGFGDQPGVTVTSRLRPDYAPIGIHIGGFTLLPELSETTGYDSNVTGTNQPHGSAVVNTDGDLRAFSNWGANSLGGELTVHNSDFLQQSNQSFTSWSASVGGTYDAGHDTLSVGYIHLNLIQTPRDLDVPQLDQPIAYRVDDVHLSYDKRFNRLSVQPGIEITSYRYDNGTVGGSRFNQDFRNRVMFVPNVVVSYELFPGSDIVFVMKDADAHYVNQTAGIPTLGFNDLSALGGISYDTGLVKFRFLAGYETRHFVSQQYATISAPILEGSMTWTPTGLTTVTATAARYIQDSTSEATVGYTETALKLSVDHELYRNVLLNANVTYLTDTYPGSGSGSQSYYQLGGGVTWLINRNLQLVASYQYSNRQNNGSSVGFASSPMSEGAFGNSYTENAFLLQLRVRL